MKTIVVASAKGGVGKTTIAAGLAAEGARRGQRTAIVDLDPLQCLARWHDSRKRVPDVSAVALIDSVSTGEQAVRVARRRADVDWLIIDTSPGPAGRVQTLMKVADVLVIPVRPSPVDVQCLDAMLDLATTSDTPHVVVLNGVSRGSQLLEGARGYLSARSIRTWDDQISADDALAIAMIDGHTGAEHDPSGRTACEFASLWDEVATLSSVARVGRRVS